MSAKGLTAAAQTGVANTQPLASANTGFGFSVLKELAKEKPEANLFISPYSIASVLQMISTGARGQTQQELQQALGTASLSPDDRYAAYQGLSQSITDQTNVTLNVANALWYRAGARLSPRFMEINRGFYRATIDPLDFSASSTAKVMNDWAAKNTRGKIPTIISPPIPADTAMVLANAIYFKGTWLNPFDPRQTRPRLFHLLNGTPQSLPMMEQTRSFLYQEEGGFQAVQLPYAGNELVMQVLLPRTNSTLAALLGTMDAKVWEKTVLPAFEPRRGSLILPRFTFKFGADLKAPLLALGIKSALSASADFSGISSSRLYLSQIKHDSFVEVNEQGTEAAAVTTGVMALAAFRNEPPPFQMTVDRPFLFVISDQRTRCILFAGLVFAPGGSSQGR
jgi:serpin B